MPAELASYLLRMARRSFDRLAQRKKNGAGCGYTVGMKKLVLNSVGVLAVILGIIGIFLPLLPTTPFLLLAAACFARGSERLHGWLLNHRLFGAYLRAWEEGRGIPARAKALALVMMWSSLGYAAWRSPHWWLQLGMLAIGAGVSVYLLRLPTARPAGRQ
jgi:uncharacterized protein